MSNIITVRLGNSRRVTAPALFQFDYGQILKPDAPGLPENYEVHFSAGSSEEAWRVNGDADGAAIPDVLLTLGQTLHAYLFLHTGEDDGETIYDITIPVRPRAQAVSAPDITPEERDIIVKAIEALNNAIAKTDANVAHYPRIVNDVWEVWDADAGEFISTGIPATGPQGSLTPDDRTYLDSVRTTAESSATAAQGSATAAQGSAAAAQESANAADESADNADSYREDAQIAASEAHNAANEASTYATDASVYAGRAENDSETVKGLVASAHNDKMDAESAASEARAAANDAETCYRGIQDQYDEVIDAAQDAQTYAQSARTAAQAAQDCAEQAYQSSIEAIQGADIFYMTSPGGDYSEPTVEQILIELGAALGYTITRRG